MSGYVPLFDSLTKGTLCGRWPDIGLWPIVLSLSDKHGVVDVTPAFIAGVTGLTVEDVTACMRRFCEPDPYSRSPVEGGARLVLLDDHREWGWQIVNHSSYREKARKSAYDADRTASGADAVRKKREREGLLDGTVSRRVPTRPALSGAVPLSDSDANTDSNKEKNPSASSTPANDEQWLLDFKLAYPHRSGDQGWVKAKRAANARIAEGHTTEDFIAGAKRYAAFCEATGKTGTEYVKQACTFLGPGKPFLDEWKPPPSKAQVKQDRNISASQQWLAEQEAKDAAH